MSPRTDHPPRTDDPARSKSVRRAVVGGIAGVALLVGPVALANVIVPDDGKGDQVEAAAESETSLVALRRSATEADMARAQRAWRRCDDHHAAPAHPTTKAPPTTDDRGAHHQDHDRDPACPPPRTRPRRTAVAASATLATTRHGTPRRLRVGWQLGRQHR